MGPDPAHGAPTLDSNPAALHPWPSSTATSHGGRPLPEATMGTPPLPPVPVTRPPRRDAPLLPAASAARRPSPSAS